MPVNVARVSDMDQTVETLSRMDASRTDGMMHEIAVFLVHHQDAVECMQFVTYRLGTYL